MRRMRCAVGHVGKEGLVGRHHVEALHPRNHLVGDVLGEVIALFGRLRRLDRCRTVEQGRRPLVGLATNKAVELLEALAGRPAVEWTRHADFPRRCLVGLANTPGAVAVEPQHLGDGGYRVGSYAVVARSTGSHFSHRADSGRVMVAAGQQRDSSGRAQRRRMEAVVEQAIIGNLLQCGHIARATRHARGPKAHIVEQHQHDIRGALGRAQRVDRRELGIASIERHLALSPGCPESAVPRDQSCLGLAPSFLLESRSTKVPGPGDAPVLATVKPSDRASSATPNLGTPAVRRDEQAVAGPPPRRPSVAGRRPLPQGKTPESDEAIAGRTVQQCSA